MSKKVVVEEPAFPGQHDGEDVRMLFRQHPLVMRKALIVGLLAILVAVTPLAFPMAWDDPAVSGLLLKIAFITPGIVLLIWVYRWLAWYYTVYIVTNQRILAITQKGLFDRKVEEWQLDAITNVNYHINGFQAVLFGYGDIVAKTYIGDLEIRTVHKPVDIHEQLLREVRKAGGGGSTQAPNIS
jgi:hypothetical protein